MALPPRFPLISGVGFGGGFSMIPPIMQQPQAYFVGVPNTLVSGGPRFLPQQNARKTTPVEKAPQTTAFVGNIHDRCSNDLIRAMLQECGEVISWKRIQGSNGKFKAFGFCEFIHPESTLRALRLLHDMRLADKKLVVKVDDKTRNLIREFVSKKRKQQGKSELTTKKDELPVDEEMTRNDEPIRQVIIRLVRAEAPELLVTRDSQQLSPTLEGKGGNLDVATLDRDEKEYIRDEIERFRQAYQEEDEAAKLAAVASSKTTASSQSSSTVKSAKTTNEDNGGHSRGSRGRSSSRRKRAASRSRSRESSPKRSKRAPSADSGESGSKNRDDYEENGNESKRGSRRRKKRKEKRRRSSSSSSGSSSSRHSFVENSKHPFKSRSPSRDVDSEDSEVVRERTRQNKYLREKETAYQLRLEQWEGRERREAKTYDKVENREKQRKREQQKEARKLKEFLEDYDDERDDPKYYKSSSLFQRKREFERERESDLKDRQKEQEEIEELKRQVLAEGTKVEDPEAEALKRYRLQEETLLRKMRADSGSPSPHILLGEVNLVLKDSCNANNNENDNDDNKEEEADEDANDTDEDDDDDEDEEDSSSEEENESSVNVGKKTKKKLSSQNAQQQQQAVGQTAWLPVDGRESGDELRQLSPVEQQQNTTTTTSHEDGEGGGGRKKKERSLLSGIFGEDVDEGDYLYMKQAKMKPFEITQEERIQAMTPEERKELIKDLIEKIPTSKAELFDFPVSWEQVDETLVERRVKPWVTKKIVDYIGEEEATLIDFICQQVKSKTTPYKIFDDISMVLDDEAEVFVVKMWRLIIYESEAKKLGLVKIGSS